MSANRNTLNGSSKGGVAGSAFAPAQTAKVAGPKTPSAQAISTKSAEANPPKKRRRSKRRPVSRDTRKYISLDEFADELDVSVRTLEREAADGLLELSYIRGARRVSERGRQAYLRKVRGLSTLHKRRRSPHPKCKSKKKGETQ